LSPDSRFSHQVVRAADSLPEMKSNDHQDGDGPDSVQHGQVIFGGHP